MNAAIEDLKNTGLPKFAKILILNVTENWTLIFKESDRDAAVYTAATDSKIAFTVEIMLGDATDVNSRHLSRTVSEARIIRIISSASGQADGLEIEDAKEKNNCSAFRKSKTSDYEERI